MAIQISNGCQWTVAIAGDVALLPGAGLLCVAAMLKSTSVNPTTPILLLHGSGFNDMEWYIGKHFLGQKYGPVFSLNYDGIVSNDPMKGIDDYAKGKVRDYILQITSHLRDRKVHLIGHSMGGLIAGYYAEYCADADGVQVDKVITVATPWQGTPTLNIDNSIFNAIVGPEQKRCQQMSQKDDANQTRRRLLELARQSEEVGRRQYYNIWSQRDYAVPFQSGQLTRDPSRCYEYRMLGHYMIIIWPQTWWQIQKWLL